MALFRRAWSVPKDGNAEEENEDAFKIEEFKGDDGYQGLFIAISDGASGAIYSRSWAQSLVVAAKPEWPTIGDDSLSEQIQRVRKQFSPLRAAENIQWYVRTKFLTEGSQATLLLVTVNGWRETDSSTVHAVSVGDCCLLLFRRDGAVNSFPN